MKALRALLRVPLVLLVSALASGTILAVRILRPVVPRVQLAIRNAVFRTWGKTLCRIMGMRIEVEGTPPSGGFFLVTNHVGYVDIMLLASQVAATFIAKADLRRWPILGWMFSSADTIFIDRTRRKDILRVMERVKGCLDRGLGVLLFAEGTSGKGEEVLRLKPSLLELAAAERYPVHYAILTYRTPGEIPAHQMVCWWDDTPFVTHFVRLLGLPSFEATLRFGSEPILASDRKTLAEQLRSAMAETFTPVS